MKRKIVQIACCQVDCIASTQCSMQLYALCDDGTLWWKSDQHHEWIECPEIPQPAAQPGEGVE